MTVHQPFYNMDQQVLLELKIILGSAIGFVLATIIAIIIICKLKGESKWK